MQTKRLLLSTAVILSTCVLNAQQRQGDPKLTEVWEPVPAKVTAGKTPQEPPSDAIVLFNGKNTDAWKQVNNGEACKWEISEMDALTVKPGTGNIQTKQGFGDCQLHIEWRSPAVVKGEGQMRGNSGIFLMGRYELQVLDNFTNKTYSNGQAGSLYKQSIPLVNACKGPGEWQTYDIIFTAPRFNENGTVKDVARITVLHNGVLVQNNTALWGPTEYIGIPQYAKHGDKEPIMLQDHGDLVSFRNIWIRNL
jgi:Domain of Unknown Function (DUF1080)